ncbi:rod shape-determining protein MreC [Patescibacteria group bacterium]|nr:rod shape-determining protein MreC [Patescibacteria group bacterium]
MHFSRFWKILATIAGIFVLLLLFRGVLGEGSSTLGGTLLRFRGSALWRVGTSLHHIFSPDPEDPTTKIAELQKERDALIVENAKLRDAAHEAENLAALLQFQKRSATPLVTAQVIAGSTDPDIHTIDIDRGTGDGVTEGDAVVANEGIVVGKVTKARAKTATIELLTDAQSRFAAALLGADAMTVHGYTEGGHGTGMVMRLIPQQVKVTAGDVVITSGLEENIPRGLVLGRVESVRQEPNEPFQDAILSPLASLDALTTVAVLHVAR